MRRAIQTIVGVTAAGALALAGLALIRLRPATSDWLARLVAGNDAYAGSSSCRECHETFYQKWAPSHHGKAMQPVTAEFVAESLTPLEQPMDIRGRRFTVDLANRQMTEETAGARRAHYPILHAMGGKNVFYFLTLLEKGRLQVLPLAYNVRDRKWYDTTGSMVRHFAETGDQPLDWTDSMLTFNTACFSCHVSQLAKNYDAQSGAYRTVWREPGISCETCHGPSERHNRLCRALPAGEKPKDLGLTSWRAFTPDQANSACAPCHAKMHPLTSAFVPGETFFDYYDLVCLEDRDFSPDGRDKGENYTYTLWLMNPCAQKGGLDCMHCHTSSGRYRFAVDATNDVNAACSSCHADKAKRIMAHSRHPADGATGRCISCHMPMTSFAAMNRSDHSHRPPCPEAAVRFGSTSACMLCHKDKKETWAASFVNAWHPDSTWRPKILREGGLVDAARKREWGKLPEMLAYLQETNAEPVVCTSLLRLLRGCPEPGVWPVVRGCLLHPMPLVRSAAASALADDLRDPATADALCRALADPVRVVRVQAVQSLAAYPRRALDAATLARLKRAETELLAMYVARPDDWASHYNLGNYRLSQGDAKGAMSAYQDSIRLRADAVMPHVNAAVLASQQGNLQEALGYLRAAWRASPEHGAVNLNLGLALAEAGDGAGAVQHLRTAMKDPLCRAQAAYNCAVLVGAQNPAEAVELCRAALEAEPANSRYAETLEYYRRAAGQAGAAVGPRSQ
jgi:tetratricopeptide (TPR) repeat protein